MSLEGVVESVVVEAPAAPALPEEAPLPLGQLEAALDPLRRTLAFSLAAEPPSAPRYLSANAQRLLQPALALDLPQAVRERLAALAACLVQHDVTPAEGRSNLLHEAAQNLARLDAMLGLPLRSRGRGRARARVLPAPGHDEVEPKTEPTPAARAEAKAPEAASGERGRGARRREGREGRDAREGAASKVAESKSAPRSLPAAEPSPRSERRYRPGDPEHLGRSLRDMGVPDSVLAALEAAGIETPWALLTTRPSGEEALKPIHGAGRDLPEGIVAVGGRVVARATRCSPDGTQTSEVWLKGAGLLRVCWSGPAPAWLLDRLRTGERVVLAGRCDGPDGDGVLWDPEPVVEDGHHGARLLTYGVEGVDDRVVRALIAWMLPHVQQVRDPIPAEVLARVGLPALPEAITDLHTKGSAAPKALARLAFEEALLTVVAHSSTARKAGRERGLSHYVAHAQAARMVQIGELQVSDAQQMCLEDVKRDLRGNQPMYRVISGPAGGGRALVALLAAVAVAEAKAQVLWLAPDSTLSELRSLFCEPLLREVSLVGRHVAESPSANLREALRRGDIHVVFGTPALLQADLEFRRLGLVVVEERGEEGVNLEGLASSRGARPDVLVLAGGEATGAALLGRYATADVSELRPAKGRKVHARAYPVAARAEAYARAGALLASGQQVLVVFPMARGAELLDGREALRVKAALESDAFRGARVGLFHSSLGRDDRLRTLADWNHRRLDVLITTLPLEDGPPILGLGAVLVEQAGHMSAERLHRLRALLGASPTEGVAELLCVVDAAHDDPRVADVERIARERVADDPEEVDAENSDAPFVWLNPETDRELVLQAHREARALVAADPALKRGNHSDLGHAVGAAVEESGADTEEGGDAGGKNRRRRRRKRR